MLPVYLDCPFSLPLRYSLAFICLVSCITYVASFFGFSFFINPSIFSNIYFFLCFMNLCCQFLWIVIICLVSCKSYVASFSGLSFFITLPYSLTFIFSCVLWTYVASLSGLSFFITPSIFSSIYLSFLLYILCCQFFSGLSFFITPSIFSNTDLSCVFCALCC
jgi:hypothetical protein